MKKIKLEEPFWVLSDTHIFHTNILIYCQRKPFLRSLDLDINNNWISKEIAEARTNEMNETICNNWASMIKPKDVVIFLGDFVVGTRNKYQIARILYNDLPGKKIFIKGNHDKKLDIHAGINMIDEDLVVEYRDLKFLMSHRPRWNFNRYQFDYHIFGHIHNSSENERIDKTCMKNVSVEVVNYTPQHIDNIIEDFEVENGCLPICSAI